jgi:hypothetical protein
MKERKEERIREMKVHSTSASVCVRVWNAVRRRTSLCADVARRPCVPAVRTKLRDTSLLISSRKILFGKLNTLYGFRCSCLNYLHL